MNTAAFDTLAAARQFKGACMQDKHAEAIAQVVGQRGADYATKADLAALEGKLTVEIAAAKAALAGWLLTGFGLMLGAIVIGVALILHNLGD